MTTTLLFLALLAAANPIRVHAVRPDRITPGVLGYAAAVVMGAGTVFAVLAESLLDLVDVSASSARIAAGMALVVVSTRDALGPAPSAQPALGGDRAGLVPVAFPAMMNPATAVLMVAAAVDRGVGTALFVLACALTVTLAIVRGPRFPASRLLLVATGAGGVATGVLVVMDGVLAI